MAEESHVIRGINWRETFPFTHLFRTFRIAIHPSKLFLALAALLALYLGGRILDGVWIDRHKALPGEIYRFDANLYGPNVQPMGQWRQAQRTAAREHYALILRDLEPLHAKGKPYSGLWDPQVARAAAQASDYIDDTEHALGVRRDTRVEQARETYRQAPRTDPQLDEAARTALEASVREAYASYQADMQTIEVLRGVGLFSSFLRYQTDQANSAALGVIRNDWLGDRGVLWSVARFFTVGPAWAAVHHPLFFILFGALFMVVWSTFGGAISRIAAVHVADEGRKLSIRQGLSFSISKFLSFLSAPLIPLLIVLLIGIALAAAGGLLFALRLNIVVGLAFFLALAAGIVMTLVLLGTIGGFGLMYPTIAVEGSDSFDAISRSFSYVYARPWRMLFYTLVALVYGALTFLFVRLFIWLTLLLTHYFVGMWVLRDAEPGFGLWETMFPTPQNYWNLPYDVPFALLSSYSAATAFFIAFWNYLLIAMLGAFAISFYFSANTIIYYLMRREVDATEMDDVYLEQPEDDFVETPAAPATAVTVQSASAPAATTLPGSEGAPADET
jgi:hypothetical protein